MVSRPPLCGEFKGALEGYIPGVVRMPLIHNKIAPMDMGCLMSSQPLCGVGDCTLVRGGLGGCMPGVGP